MAGRGLTTAAQTELQKSQIRLAYLVKLEFDSGTITLFSAPGQVTYLGDVYEGKNGSLVAISQIEETLDNRATGHTVSVIADTSLISVALNEHYQGRPATIYLALFNEQFSIILDPVVISGSIMDNMQIRDSGREAVIQINLESKAIRDQVVKIKRWTDSEQQEMFPGDGAFLRTPKIAREPIYWGNVR